MTSGTFSLRYTADARPVLMVDVVVTDDVGWRMFSVPLWALKKATQVAALDELVRLTESLCLYDY